MSPSTFQVVCKGLDFSINSTVAMSNYAMVMEKNPDPNSPEAKQATLEMLRVVRQNSEFIQSNLQEIDKGFVPDPRNRKLIEGTKSANVPAKQSAKPAPVPMRHLTPFENAAVQAQQGDAKAQLNLGLYYLRGEGVAKDEAKGVEWLRKSAEQGEASAQTALGISFARGNGQPQDDVQAVYWLHKAAEQGYALAQANLGVHYDRGVGVAEDKEAARQWYLKAAEQGNASAQFNLGLFYSQGNTVPRLSAGHDLVLEVRQPGRC